jgi:hypothetical protein
MIFLFGDPDCNRVDSASQCTNDMWVNGVARSWATAFFVEDSVHAREELAIGDKITFADGTIRTIVHTKEGDRNLLGRGGNLIVFLDGPPLDGRISPKNHCSSWQ